VKLKTTLTCEETERLDKLESSIQRGKKTFVEVGIALAAVRDEKLYRRDYDTFEAYCKDKWGWTRQHAYRLIECAPMVECNPQVTSLNQARALCRVPEPSRAAVMDAVQAKGRVTAKAIADEASRITCDPETDEPETPHVKTYDVQMMKAMGKAHIPTAEELSVIDECEVSISNLRFVIDELQAGTFQRDELADIKNQFALTLKKIGKL
jgi:hypothetical protein